MGCSLLKVVRVTLINSNLVATALLVYFVLCCSAEVILGFSLSVFRANLGLWLFNFRLLFGVWDLVNSGYRSFFGFGLFYFESVWFAL